MLLKEGSFCGLLMGFNFLLEVKGIRDMSAVNNAVLYNDLYANLKGEVQSGFAFLDYFTDEVEQSALLDMDKVFDTSD